MMRSTLSGLVCLQLLGCGDEGPSNQFQNNVATGGNAVTTTGGTSATGGAPTTGGSGSTTGGSSGTAGSGPSACAATGPCTPVPDESGWIEMANNPIGLQGAWYPYGDQYGTPPSGAKCTGVGLHVGGQTAPPAECSIIESPPPPPASGFPNLSGKMCAKGSTAVVLPCPDGLTTSGCPDMDYSNMWGAGIGLDLNANKGAPEGDGARHPWNPDTYGITGVAFDIDTLPAAKLRVEFLMQLPDGTTTEDHPDGSPYWGATSSYPASPVAEGHNEFVWEDVKAPNPDNYEFDRTKIMAIQFHVPAKTSGTERGAFEFCISNLTWLRP